MSGFSTTLFASVSKTDSQGNRRATIPHSNHDELLSRYLPIELIQRVLSYLPIAFCTYLLQSIPLDHELRKLIYRSVYERNIFFGYPFRDWKWKSKTGSLKQIGCSELELLVSSESRLDLSVPPKTFIFDYTYDNYCNLFGNGKWLETFTNCMKASQRYFALIQNLELHIDVEYKEPGSQDDNWEIDTVASVFSCSKSSHNLTQLHLRGFQDKILSDQSLESLLLENLPHCINLKELDISSSSLKHFEKLKFPRSITSLVFVNNGKIVLPVNDKDFFPPYLESLILFTNKISSIVNVSFPPTLGLLELENNSLKTLDGVIWPPALRVLNLCSNKLHLSEEQIQLPPKLQVLSLRRNPIRSFDGVDFPNSLERISLDDEYSDLPINVPRRDSIFYS